MALRAKAVTIWTIGHSILPIEAFRALLTTQGIRLVVDVRRFPASRRHPQYNREALAVALDRAGMRYEPMPELGGRRTPRANSTNTGWRNPSFRGYADYAETLPFENALSRLLELAEQQSTAVMCAEALWWRCHRALISDYLSVAGTTVLHITSSGSTVVHALTGAARVVDGQLKYTAEPPVRS